MPFEMDSVLFILLSYAEDEDALAVFTDLLEAARSLDRESERLQALGAIFNNGGSFFHIGNSRVVSLRFCKMKNGLSTLSHRIENKVLFPL